MPRTASAPAPDPLVAAALARARSGRVPRPPAALPRAAAAPRGPGIAPPPPLDRLLRLALAASPEDLRGRLRPAPSAGALHPVTAHLLAGPGGALPPGRHRYDPLHHRLHPTGPAPADAPPGTLAVLTLDPVPTTAHYGHRGWPLLLLDAGHTAAALVLAGAAALCLDADGDLLARAAGLTTTGRHHPVAALRLTPEGPADALERWAADTDPPTRSPHPTGRLLHALTRAPGTTPSWQAAPAPRHADALLLQRRSAPPGFPHPPSAAELGAVLRTATEHGPAAVSWCAATGGPRPGLRRLGPDGRGPVLLATGEARPTLAAWAARQDWIADSGALLLAHGCPGDAPSATIRAAHLGAGYAMGHAQLAAAALGLRSRPVGSWQRADLGAALGGPADRDWVLHGLALGRTEDDPSGPPALPTATPRDPS
ncbi:nitroreductase [Streptomyces sp. NPDC047097]|uniref:nitroreductase n=1 Tax=Streptomyces sp. NPDC047097 TaxID=3155260 RepID=UPI0033EB8887